MTPIFGSPKSRYLKPTLLIYLQFQNSAFLYKPKKFNFLIVFSQIFSRIMASILVGLFSLYRGKSRTKILISLSDTSSLINFKYPDVLRGITYLFNESNPQYPLFLYIAPAVLTFTPKEQWTSNLLLVYSNINLLKPFPR